MKKFIAAVLLLIFAVSLALSAFGDVSTELTYDLNSNYYEISVPSTLSLNNGSAELGIVMTENHTGSNVNVQITGKYSNSGAGWRLLTSENQSLAEQLGFDVLWGDTVIAPGAIIPVGVSGVKLNVIINSSDLRYAPNGTYKEKLTFTLS